MTELLDFSKICRVCCLEGNLMSIFKVHISKKIMACSSIQVWPNDQLPNKICSKCIAKLHIAFQFKKLSEKSDLRLRNYIQSQKEKQTKDNNPIEDNRLISVHDNANTHPIPENQNEYIFVECPTNINSKNHDLLPQNSQLLNQQLHNSLTHLSYQNSVHNLQQLNGYPVQNIHVPPALTLPFPSYNITEPRHILTIGQLPPTNHLTTNTTNPKQQSENGQIKQDKINENESNSNYEVAIKLENSIKTEQCCNICSKEFSSSTKLTRHMKIHSGEQPYRCNICSKGFAHSGNFKVHMRMHTDERPFQCRMCEKACRQQQDLEKHMRTHTGEKPHGCKICGKAFTTSSNLIAHSRIHSGEKPYVCPICQKAFCQSNELTKHSRTHTGEKSHICDICNRGFNGSSTLIVHMRSHTGERPYVCNICHKGFTQSSCLHVHMKRHNTDQNFICQICSNIFPNVDELEKHFQSHENLK